MHDANTPEGRETLEFFQKVVAESNKDIKALSIGEYGEHALAAAKYHWETDKTMRAVPAFALSSVSSMVQIARERMQAGTLSSDERLVSVLDSVQAVLEWSLGSGPPRSISVRIVDGRTVIFPDDL